MNAEVWGVLAGAPADVVRVRRWRRTCVIVLRARRLGRARESRRLTDPAWLAAINPNYVYRVGD